MARSTIGLDIGTSAVRAAEVRGKDPATLVRYAQIPLPAGAMVGGEIADHAAVVSALRDLWRRGEFRGKRVAVAVANPNVVVREVDVPRMAEQDLRGALKYQVQDYIPIPVDEALLDFLSLGEFVGGDGAPMMRVLAVAAHKDMVNAFVRALGDAGLEPTAIDLAALAAVRALSDPVPPLLGEPDAEAFIDVGAGVTSLAVQDRGSPLFIRILPEGGADVTAALVEALRIDEQEAEAQKSILGLQPEGAPVAPGAASVIEERARAFIEDVRRSLEYYASEGERTPARRAVLTGGGGLLPGLRERLVSALGIPVEFGNALSRVKIGDLGLSPEQLDQVAAVGAVAVGLALES